MNNSNKTGAVATGNAYRTTKAAAKAALGGPTAEFDVAYDAYRIARDAYNSMLDATHDDWVAAQEEFTAR